MTQQRITDSLTTLFATHPVVFWHDIESEFSSVVDGLQLDGVQLVRLDDTPALRVKLDIERTPNQRWLIYSAQPEPEPVKDWLLDVRMRSKSFRAYSTSILLEDLGLPRRPPAPRCTPGRRRRAPRPRRGRPPGRRATARS